MNIDEMMAFLDSEITKAETQLRFRLDSQKCWAGGTDKSWSVVGCTASKAERMKTSEIHDRIAPKCLKRITILTAIKNELLKKKE